MTILYEKNTPLSFMSTFRMGGTATNVAILENEEDLAKLFADMEKDTRWFFVGGGSNIVFPDGDCNTLIIKYTSSHIKILNDEKDYAELAADAGQNWDEFVKFSVLRGYSGLEALSAIPGTVGATPIQNVGAYGSEVKDTITFVRAFDTKEKTFREFSNAECEFGYRDSIFKREAKNRYIITEVRFRLSKSLPEVPNYPGVGEYLSERGIVAPTGPDIRSAIMAIRAKKLPDPREVASCGSFFKNPIIEKDRADKLKELYPSLAVFSVSETKSKVGAGSLIDTLGWKGRRLGSFSFYKGNAMVIVNEGGGTRAELEELIKILNIEIYKKYGLMLEPEPEMVEF